MVCAISEAIWSPIKGLLKAQRCLTFCSWTDHSSFAPPLSSKQRVKIKEHYGDGEIKCQNLKKKPKKTQQNLHFSVTITLLLPASHLEDVAAMAAIVDERFTVPRPVPQNYLQVVGSARQQGP